MHLEDEVSYLLRLSERADAHRGPEGIAEIPDRDTGVVVFSFDFSGGSLTINSALMIRGANTPPGLIEDAARLLLTYVGEVKNTKKGG